MIDLIDARIDLAIRIGRLVDPSWIARKLCDLEVILCASPDYLGRHRVPAAPQDLTVHRWLAFGRDAAIGVVPDGLAPPGNPMLAMSPRGASAHASLRPVKMTLDMQSATGERHRLRIASNNQISLQQPCEHDLGIAHLAHADVVPALRHCRRSQISPEDDPSPEMKAGIAQTPGLQLT